MTRVLMGPPASRWWIAYLLVFGACLVEALAVRRWGIAALVLAVLAAGLVTTAWSLLAQIVVHLVACALAAASALIAALEGRTFWAVFGVLATLALAAVIPLARREGSGGRIRTEELVGLTVPQAERLLGYPLTRAPGGLGAPVLVPVPFGPRPDGADPGRRAALVVTSVAVDPAGPWIAFGVAPIEWVPALDRDTRGLLQEELRSRIGGFAAALRPERPGSARRGAPPQRSAPVRRAPVARTAATPR
ncbi:hypothetical protein [Tsukamurella pulmonis]|uniref:hypothetical protein n=1 Tax=Tsukamurella pulmonis TaxID=47312 RepID=UPI001EE14FDA|nr:hypothetical protein [Tsukamurella pulmonis]